MAEYFNGSHTVEVENIDKLTNLNQEETNNLACGPQDAFFDKMEWFNGELEAFDIKPIGVTNKWNWKPGSYDRVKEYMNKKLELNKKAMSIDKIMTRAQDRMNYMNYVRRQASEMEFQKAKLKRMGVSKDVDLDTFTETCMEFVNDLKSQCESVYKLTNNKVKIKPYVQLNDRNTMLYFDIMLSDLIMSVYSGRTTPKLIQQIPMNDIKVIVSQSLRHKLNKQYNTLTTPKGIIAPLDESNNWVKYCHPYISNNYNNINGFGTICLDNYFDDISKALKENNMLNFAVAFMQWAQYYHMEISNPYNQPYKLHVGMPKSFSNEYKSVVNSSDVVSSCGQRLHDSSHQQKLTSPERDMFILDKCNSIECDFQEFCSTNRTIQKRIENMEKDDFYTKAEAMAFLIADEMFKDGYITGEDSSDSFHQISYNFETITGREIYKRLREDSNEFFMRVVLELISYFADFGNFDNYVFDYLEKQGYEILKEKKEKVPSVADMDDEQIKTAMKLWAETQGGA